MALLASLISIDANRASLRAFSGGLMPIAYGALATNDKYND
jgi:hypothetical protein